MVLEGQLHCLDNNVLHLLFHNPLHLHQWIQLCRQCAIPIQKLDVGQVDIFQLGASCAERQKPFKVEVLNGYL